MKINRKQTFWAPTAEQEFLNQKEAAGLLGVSAKTLRDETKRGGVPCKKIGARYVYSRQALIKWAGLTND